MRWCAARAGGGCRSDGGCGGSFCKGSAEDVDGDAEEDDVEGVTPAAGAPGIFGGITSLMILAMGVASPVAGCCATGRPCVEAIAAAVAAPPTTARGQAAVVHGPQRSLPVKAVDSAAVSCIQ